jgi:hypothetical protein
MGAQQPVSEREFGAGDLLNLAAQRWFDELADRGIIVTDRALVVQAWNPWLVAQTGIAAEAAIGQPLFAVAPTIAARGLDEHYRRALEGEVRVLAHRFHKFLIPVRSAAGASEPTQNYATRFSCPSGRGTSPRTRPSSRTSSWPRCRTKSGRR